MTNEEETEKTNTFAEMESAGNKEQTKEIPNKTETNSAEINVEDFSDTAVGEKKKYIRPNLDKTKDVVDKFQVFTPDTTEEPKESRNKSSKYWPVTMILTYGSKNADEVNNREYISGARVFENKSTGDSVSDINFWYSGGTNQACYLWELVAKKLGKKPEDISPREMIAFLNSKPIVNIVGMEYDNFGAPAGSPKKVIKNMPGEFI